MSQFSRPRIGEALCRQGEIMLGHAKISTSDIYAPFGPANLGVAFTVVEGMVEEIEGPYVQGVSRRFSPEDTGCNLIQKGRYDS